MSTLRNLLTWFPSTDAKAECQLPCDDSCNLKLFQHGTLANLNPPYHEGMMFSSREGVQQYSPPKCFKCCYTFANILCIILAQLAACLHKVVNYNYYLTYCSRFKLVVKFAF